MDLSVLAFILFAAGIVLLTAEAFLPSYGLLGLAGGGAIGGGIVCCFMINQYLGIGVLVGSVLASPFIFTLIMRVYPKTPIGKKMVLEPLESRLKPPLIRLGETGTALSDLRPMGTCQFGRERVEVRSDMGMIPAGTKVKVVNIDAGRLIVRPVDAKL